MDSAKKQTEYERKTSWVARLERAISLAGDGCLHPAGRGTCQFCRPVQK